ncbi:uncharacterized protein [Dysidea avara]|uniref:uncharacterized protein isoform X2 n=1 Tax=Dysidea avara TaxID=196820 RepID=UPI003324A113
MLKGDIHRMSRDNSPLATSPNPTGAATSSSGIDGTATISTVPAQLTSTRAGEHCIPEGFWPTRELYRTPVESLDDYYQSCGMISLDDDTTDMVRCNSCSWGYHERCLGRHVVIARQDENGYNFSGSCCSSNGAVPL